MLYEWYESWVKHSRNVKTAKGYTDPSEKDQQDRQHFTSIES